MKRKTVDYCECGRCGRLVVCNLHDIGWLCDDCFDELREEADL